MLLKDKAVPTQNNDSLKITKEVEPQGLTEKTIPVSELNPRPREVILSPGTKVKLEDAVGTGFSIALGMFLFSLIMLAIAGVCSFFLLMIGVM